MRIFITSHNSRYGGGISVARNLISAFGRVAPHHEYFFTIPPDLDYEECCQIAPQHETLVYQHRALVQRWIWETFTLPQIIREFQPDVIFNVANRGVTFPQCPQATLIQDPHLFYPVTHFGDISQLERFKFWYHRRHLKKSLNVTQLLFCQTEVATERLHKTYGNGFSIRLCPNQFSLFATASAAAMAEPEPLRPLAGKFKLFVLTRYYSHKNLEIIPQLFRERKSALHEVAVILTISPDQHPMAAKLLQDVKRYGLEQNIITVGALRQDELAAWYRHADALFLPTLLESFSGTYIESMSHGCPILTSDMDFAHGVCGEAALYFDPSSVDAICRSILQLKGDQALYRSLVEKGRSRLQCHSKTWDEIGRGVINGLEELQNS